MTAPLRKILTSTDPRRRPGRRGLVALSTLECGHQDWTKASERRRGQTYCFDCFYGKPLSEMALIDLRELKCEPVK